MSRASIAAAWVWGLALAATAGCGREFEGGGDLRAQKVVLQREVAGAREAVARLERGEPLLPAGDVAISIDQALVRDLIVAQLPFEVDVDRFHLVLTGADVQFQGSPAVRLRGRLNLRERPDLSAAVEALGALENIELNATSSTLTAAIAVDHLGITEATGIGGMLSGATLDEVARLVRLEITDQLPTIQIPIKVQQTIDFPALTDGPVRIDGARLPLQASVSQVIAGQGRLWVSVHVEAGIVVSGDARPTPAVPSPKSAAVAQPREKTRGKGR